MMIVITGPVASGKSTLARAVADDLASRGVPTAVIDLDVVHDRLIAAGSVPHATAWNRARAIAATEANGLRRRDIAVVIAEGSFNTATDRDAFERHLRPAAAPVYVMLRVSYEEALRRARTDPTRGVSRDPGFLEPYFLAHVAALATAPPADLVIDTERASVAEAVTAVTRLVRIGAG
jgi:shikimate kinase